MIEQPNVGKQEGKQVIIINSENEGFGNYPNYANDVNNKEDNEAIIMSDKPLKKKLSATHEPEHYQHAPKHSAFSDKSNMIQNQPTINCQVLHSENHPAKMKSSHQDSLQKYMSPQELQKAKHLKN